jgi:hypothetical protein
MAAAHDTAAADWPALPYDDWKDTCRALQLWTQVAGKVRLAQSPWLNHSWHVPLYLTARGLGTSLIPHVRGPFDIEFDFVAHQVWLRAADGADQAVALRPMSTARFHADLMGALEALGRPVRINGSPNEVAGAAPFAEDVEPRPYDAEAAHRFWRVLLRAHEVMAQFRTGFLGKASPVHFFWGSFDLAVTRFSGRLAPPHPGGVPALPDAVAREAYSHEVSSAGFWPGGGSVDYPAFYAYAYPEPNGFRTAAVRPAAAFYSADLGEFILPYDAVRSAPDPAAALLEFLSTTYEAAARAADWDRGLTCDLGRPGIPRDI